MGSGEWEDEEPLAFSPFAIRHSLFTIRHSLFAVRCSLFTFAPFLRGETPRRRPVARRASHLKRGSAVWGQSPHFNNSTFLGPVHGSPVRIWSSLLLAIPDHEKFSASMSNTTMTSSGRLVRASTACTWRLSDRARCARMTIWNRNCP